MYELIILHSAGSLCSSFEYQIYNEFTSVVTHFLTDGTYSYVDCQKDDYNDVKSVTFKFKD